MRAFPLCSRVRFCYTNNHFISYQERALGCLQGRELPLKPVLLGCGTLLMTCMYRTWAHKIFERLYPFADSCNLMCFVSRKYVHCPRKLEDVEWMSIYYHKTLRPSVFQACLSARRGGRAMARKGEIARSDDEYISTRCIKYPVNILTPVRDRSIRWVKYQILPHPPPAK